MQKSKEKKNANDKMIEETARDYAAFIKVNLPNKTKGVHEAIEEMLIRLEEFESIVGMVQNLRAECEYEHLVRLRSVHPQLLELCKRIDALEHVVARASIDLASLETAVDSAESELGGYTTVSDRLFGILNPLSLFKSKSPDAAMIIQGSSSGSLLQPAGRDPFELPSIYKTEDAFETSQ